MRTHHENGVVEFTGDDATRITAATCGTCGRSWDDTHVSSRTPAPAGRCPFEYEHCDCSEEYGPCEDHCDVLVVRDGASLRTADELALVRCDDCIDVGVSDERCDELARLWAALEASRDPVSGCAWFDDPDDAEEAYELADLLEQDLPEDVRLYADDGYRIVRLTGGPLVEVV